MAFPLAHYIVVVNDSEYPLRRPFAMRLCAILNFSSANSRALIYVTAPVAGNATSP
jgi:hypothetical protein